VLRRCDPEEDGEDDGRQHLDVEVAMQSRHSKELLVEPCVVES
jgi:hypothetical protein